MGLTERINKGLENLPGREQSIRQGLEGRDSLQRAFETADRALFAEHGDDFVNAGARGRAGEGDADGLGELAELEAAPLEDSGKDLLDVFFVQFRERRQFFGQLRQRLAPLPAPKLFF